MDRGGARRPVMTFSFLQSSSPGMLTLILLAGLTRSSNCYGACPPDLKKPIKVWVLPSLFLLLLSSIRFTFKSLLCPPHCFANRFQRLLLFLPLRHSTNLLPKETSSLLRLPHTQQVSTPTRPIQQWDPSELKPPSPGSRRLASTALKFPEPLAGKF